MPGVVVLLERQQVGEVSGGVANEHTAHGRNGIDSPVAAQDHADQTSPHATVAIDERMNGLKLRVHDSGLKYRCEIDAIRERHEIVDEGSAASGGGGT
jgi:hypothetical protein